MKAQTPAQGILKVNDWGNSVMYKAVCDCGQDDCSHTIDIEADHGHITVIVYTTEKTDYWSEKVQVRYDIDNSIYQNIHWFFVGMFNDWCRRFSLIWKILTKGYVEYQSSLIMSKQVALNYAETLKSAISDLEKIDAEKSNKQTTRIAEQGDCV